MSIEMIELQQGTQAWLEHRTRHYNASDAASALGLSRYKTRQQLMREKSTGIIPEVDAATQRRFDKGHEFEAIARLWAEEIIGAELYPVVLAGKVDGLPLSASLDGLTMLEDIAFEHKTGRADLLASLEAGVIPDEYKPQMEQCLLLSGAAKCLFMASSGDRDAMRFAWYESDPVVRKSLIAGWAMFDADLAGYRHTDPAPVAVAEPQMSLPSVSIQVNGSIALIDNLDVFGEALTAYVERINKKPETDNDFATLEYTVKTLKRAEDALDSAENGALAQAASIDAMRRTVAMLREMARTNRLMIDKIVKQEKVNRKAEIIHQASKALADHIVALNNRLGASYMPAVQGGFAAATAGLKSLDSMRDKVAGALANAKIEANEVADRIEVNHKSLLIGTENDTSHLFPDFAQVCTKLREDFAALHAMRIQQEAERKAEAAKAAEAREAAAVAAAVEAERKAGEARAAAAVEAERMAEAKRAADAAAADQRAKTSEATHGEPNATALPQAPLASSPPTPEEKRAVLVDSGDEVRAYLNTLDVSDKERVRLRAVIMGFIQFRHELRAAA